jgi:hypothetical protein
MSALTQQMADQITAYTRTSFSAPFDRAYAPTVLTEQILIRVRWPWLAFPLSLVLAGLVFLVLTILQTRRRLVRPWKGHRMPLLLAAVDGDIRKMASGGLHRRTGLEDRIGKIRMRLEFDGQDTVAFVRSDGIA